MKLLQGSLSKLVFCLSALVFAVVGYAETPAEADQTVTAVAEQANAKVNINEANLETLMSLKGIGAKTAQAIIDYRKQAGAFKSLDQLLEVKGIGDKKLAAIRDQLSL